LGAAALPVLRLGRAFNRKDRKENPQRTQRKAQDKDDQIIRVASRPLRIFFAIFAVKGFLFGEDFIS